RSAEEPVVLVAVVLAGVRRVVLPVVRGEPVAAGARDLRAIAGDVGAAVDAVDERRDRDARGVGAHVDADVGGAGIAGLDEVAEPRVDVVAAAAAATAAARAAGGRAAEDEQGRHDEPGGGAHDADGTGSRGERADHATRRGAEARAGAVIEARRED